MEKEYLKAAAEAVERQVADHPLPGMKVDPDVAEFMGAFIESSIGLEDFEFDEEA